MRLPNDTNSQIIQIETEIETAKCWRNDDNDWIVTDNDWIESIQWLAAQNIGREIVFHLEPTWPVTKIEDKRFLAW